MSTSKRVKRVARKLFRSESRDQAETNPKLVESANALSSEDFYQKYAPPDLTTILFQDVVKLPPQIRCGDAKSILKTGESLLKECLQLIELTSAQDYKDSGKGWSNSKKWKEMRLPDMKYIILLAPEDKVAGFVSFMVTYEDDHEVVYIYEIHLVPNWQGIRLGRNMMQVVEAFAENVGVSKIMLTVFRTNEGAVKWYEKLGYQEDSYSPGPRKLRNGTVKQPSYIILSKPVKR